jgi:MerR family transcriptional regulator, light-induced transcriptional regulator
MRQVEQFGTELGERHPVLVEKTLAELYRRVPELKTRYGAAGRERCREDIAFHFSTLSEAIMANDDNIFLKYVGWGKSLLATRKVKPDDLIDCLLTMQEVISGHVGKSAAETANNVLQLALDTFDSFADEPSSCIDPTSSLANLANSYLEALLSSDAEQARQVMQSAAQAGLGFQDMYQFIFQPVQREVGRLWQVNHISVAQEHYCTATTELLMSQMHGLKSSETSNGRFFVAACVAGEQHWIGIRMVSQTMETNGWRTYLTGANTPTSSLVDMARRLNVDVMGVSCATVLHLPALRVLLKSIRGASSRTKIMVGGRVFNEFPGLWKKVGADAFAEDASTAARVAGRLVGSRDAAVVRR